MITVTVLALAATLWCGGAYDPERGSNFAPCDDFQRPGQRGVESPDGGGSTADAPSEAGAAAGTCR